MKALHMVTFILTIVGALNWGLIGLADYNLVSMLLGGYPSIERLVYVLVGVSAAYILATHFKDCKTCK